MKKKLTQELETYKTELYAQNEELRLSQENLMESYSENKYLFDNAPIPYIVIDSNAMILSFNYKADETFNISNNDIKNRHFIFLLENDNIIDFTELIKKEEFQETSIRLKLKTSQKKYETFNVSIKRKNTLKKEFLICLTNIQKEIDMIEQIKQSTISIEAQSKSSMLGEMFENITHQWKQPLSTIVTVASAIKYLKENNNLSDEFLMKNIDTILDVTKYMAITIEDFRDFALDTKNTKEFNIKDSIVKTIEILHKKLIDNKIVTFELADLTYPGSENLLVQVLSNILNNAKDEFKLKHIEKPSIKIKTFEDEDYIYIDITDNAGGIQEDVKDKIFKPYVTTKASFAGTGIGLYMSKNIMKKNFKGDIEVINLENGTTFRLKLKKSL